MNLGTPEILIIAFVVVLLFGATKLPQMARSLGQSARVFKAETRGVREDQQASGEAAGTDRTAEGTRQLDHSSAPHTSTESPGTQTAGTQTAGTQTPDTQGDKNPSKTEN